MDEKLVEQISTDTGVPQELVSRSAQARAQANGVDVNAILASWSCSYNHYYRQCLQVS